MDTCRSERIQKKAKKDNYKDSPPDIPDSFRARNPSPCTNARNLTLHTGNPWGIASPP